MKKTKILRVLTENKTTGESFLSAYTEYDEVGNILNTTTYQDQDEIEEKMIAKFDSSGKKSEEIHFISEDEISEHHVFSRNEKGRIIGETISYLDGSTAKKKYDFDEATNAVTITTFDDDDEIEEKEIQKFNQNDQIVERLVFGENNKLKETQLSEYDEKQQLLKRFEYNGTKELLQELRMTYDDNGNVIKRLTLNKNQSVIESISYKYDDKNRIIETVVGQRYVVKYTYDEAENSLTEERFLANGLLQYQQISKYNEDNQLIEEDDYQTKKTYEYEYFD